MDPIDRHYGTDGIATYGGVADRDTVHWPEPVLWDDEDCILGCTAAALVTPRALNHPGRLTGDSVQLTGRREPAHLVSAR